MARNAEAPPVCNREARNDSPGGYGRGKNLMEELKERLNRIVRRRDLRDYTGLGLTAIDELIRKKEFPAPISLSDFGKAVGWLEAEVLAWQLSRLAKREAGK